MSYEFSKEERHAYDIGRRHGRNAADWAIQDLWGGRSGKDADENARRILKGIEDGDPEVLDAFNPPNLSGEWADDYSPAQLYVAVGLDDDEAHDEIMSQYEEGAGDGFWWRLEESAKEHLKHENPTPRRSEKPYSIEVRRYKGGTTHHSTKPSYDVVEVIKRKIWAEQIGNFNPFFCEYKGKRTLIHSDEGDVSDPFRRTEEYTKTFFIEIKDEMPDEKDCRCGHEAVAHREPAYSLGGPLTLTTPCTKCPCRKYAPIKTSHGNPANRDIATAFANGATKGKGYGSVFIEGDTIYSYGYHFPIATKDEAKKVAYRNAARYFVTTSKHQGMVGAALARAGYELIESDNVSLGDAYGKHHKVLPPSEAFIKERQAQSLISEAREPRRLARRSEKVRKMAGVGFDAWWKKAPRDNPKGVKLAVITKQLSRDDIFFIVHADGCRDIADDVARHDGIVDVFEATSAAAWVKDEIASLRAESEGGGGWSERQFKVMPCAAHRKNPLSFSHGKWRAYCENCGQYQYPTQAQYIDCMNACARKGFAKKTTMRELEKEEDRRHGNPNWRRPEDIPLSELSMWVDNDEGLYNWHRSSRMSKAKFIKENRAEISAAVWRVLNPEHRKNPLHEREGRRLLASSRSHLFMGSQAKSPESRSFLKGVASGEAGAVRSYARSLKQRRVGGKLAMTTLASHANPARTLIGRKATEIKLTGGHCQGQFGACYGLADGSAFIKGLFTKVPGGRVQYIAYMDEAKAKREGMNPPDRPWKHDFSSLDVVAVRCQGGIILKSKAGTPLWGNR